MVPSGGKLGKNVAVFEISDTIPACGLGLYGGWEKAWQGRSGL